MCKRAKKNEGLQATTHLVTDSSGGKKYEAARKWGNVLLVHSSWLIACLQQWRRLPEDDYPVLAEDLAGSAVEEENIGDADAQPSTSNASPAAAPPPAPVCPVTTSSAFAAKSPAVSLPPKRSYPCESTPTDLLINSRILVSFISFPVELLGMRSFCTCNFYII